MRCKKPLRQHPWTLLSVLVVAAAVAGWAMHQPLLSRLPSCLLYRATGLLCPGCGGRRCISMLSQGRWLDAMQMNALLVALGVAFVGLLLRATWQEWSHHGRHFSLSSRTAWVIVACVIGFGVLRNLPFAPFKWLAPPAQYAP